MRNRCAQVGADGRATLAEAKPRQLAAFVARRGASWCSITLRCLARPDGPIHFTLHVHSVGDDVAGALTRLIRLFSTCLLTTLVQAGTCLEIKEEAVDAAAAA